MICKMYVMGYQNTSKHKSQLADTNVQISVVVNINRRNVGYAATSPKLRVWTPVKNLESNLIDILKTLVLHSHIFGK